MILLDVHTPKDICTQVATRAKTMRKAQGLTQEQLAARSGVSLGSIRRFEQTGQIAFESLVTIASVLNCESDFEEMFARKTYKSIQEVIDEQQRRSLD